MTPTDVPEPESGESCNPVHFYRVATARHVNLCRLLTEHFTSEPLDNNATLEEEQSQNNTNSKQDHE